MLKNWRFVQPWLYDCDPPTIHHASLSCKLSSAVKLKSFILINTVSANGSFSFCLKKLENKFN